MDFAWLYADSFGMEAWYSWQCLKRQWQTQVVHVVKQPGINLWRARGHFAIHHSHISSLAWCFLLQDIRANQSSKCTVPFPAWCDYIIEFGSHFDCFRLETCESGPDRESAVFNLCRKSWTILTITIAAMPFISLEHHVTAILTEYDPICPSKHARSTRLCKTHTLSIFESSRKLQVSCQRFFLPGFFVPKIAMLQSLLCSVTRSDQMNFKRSHEATHMSVEIERS